MSQLVPEIVTAILERRGMAPEQIERFLAPNYNDHLHDPYLMTDMQVAVDRIQRAIVDQQKVVIYGDYDIDGITATAVMIEALGKMGLRATSYIPDRFEEGYGLNIQALEQLKGQGVELVISVDCGVRSVDEARWAKANGLDLVITDHHDVGPELPDAIAVVNPKREGDRYPFQGLAGVGVAFKLVQALQRRLGTPEPGQEKWLLDLVALGTVCDVMDLVDENRVLVAYGLKVMRKTRRVGLRALAKVGGIDITTIGSEQLGFVLGPRMNAAGRLEHASRSVELMMTDEEARAATIAAELDELNRRRRATQAAVFEAADAIIAERYADDPVLVVADHGWNHGIVGIVASKLAEKWQRPTIVMQILGETTKGSARSVPGFNMVDGLTAVKDRLQRYGGHAFAAGMTLETAQLDAFRQALIDHHRSLAATAVIPAEMDCDYDLEHLGQTTWSLLESLELLQPCGRGNREPILGLRGLTVERVDRMGADLRHYRLGLRDADGNRAQAVGFGLAERLPQLKPGERVRAALKLGRNEWRGNVSLQLSLVELSYE